MVHRETSAAICGLILGTLIGAGFVASGRDAVASLTQQDAQFVSYREGFVADDQYRRRAISENDKRYRPQAPLRTSGISGAIQEPTVPEGKVLDPEECRNKVRFARELEAIIIPLVPGRAIDQLVRSSMQEAFNAYMKDCLPYADMKGIQEEDASLNLEVKNGTVTRVQEKGDRRCYKYLGAARSRCVERSRGY